MNEHSLAALLPMLRPLLPRQLYITLHVEPTVPYLMVAADHLRAVYHILSASMPAGATGTAADIESGVVACIRLSGAVDATAIPALRRALPDIRDLIVRGGGLQQISADQILATFPATPYDHPVTPTVRTLLRVLGAELPAPLHMRIGMAFGTYRVARLGAAGRLAMILSGDARDAAAAAADIALPRQLVAPQTTIADAPDILAEPVGQYAILHSGGATGDDFELNVFSKRRATTSLTLELDLEGQVQRIRESLDQLAALTPYIPAARLHLLCEKITTMGQELLQQAAVLLITLNLTTPSEDSAQAEAVFGEAISRCDDLIDQHGGILDSVDRRGGGYVLSSSFVNSDAADGAYSALNMIDLHWSNAARAAGIVITIYEGRGDLIRVEIGQARGRRDWLVFGTALLNAHAQLSSPTDASR